MMTAARANVRTKRIDLQILPSEIRADPVRVGPLGSVAPVDVVLWIVEGMRQELAEADATRQAAQFPERQNEHRKTRF